MPVRHTRAQPLAASASAVLARHVGRRPGFVDEDEPVGVEIESPLEPVPATAQDVGPVLLGGVRGLFLRVILVRFTLCAGLAFAGSRGTARGVNDHGAKRAQTTAPARAAGSERQRRLTACCSACWNGLAYPSGTPRFDRSKRVAEMVTRDNGAKESRFGWAQRVRRPNMWRNSQRRLAECRLRLGTNIKRRACGVASGDDLLGEVRSVPRVQNERPLSQFRDR